MCVLQHYTSLLWINICTPTTRLLTRGFLFVKLKSYLKGFTVAPSPITYDFTFHVHILRSHWDFFIFYFMRNASHISFVHFAFALSDRLPVRVKSEISKDLHSHKKRFFNKISIIKAKKITYFNWNNPKITLNAILFQRCGQCKLTAKFLKVYFPNYGN